MAKKINTTIARMARALAWPGGTQPPDMYFSDSRCDEIGIVVERAPDYPSPRTRSAVCPFPHFAMKSILTRLLGATLAYAVLTAAAQTPYPGRPVRMIANGSPGGVIDTMARVTAASLSPRLGQSVVVENLPGAAGIIGTQAVVRAAPDGYTLLFSGVDGFDILPSLVKKMPYDPARDLIPIAKLTQVDVVLAVNARLPVSSVRELVALAKQKPGALKFASTGLGTMNHMAGELIKLRAGIDMLHVPYKGSGPAIADAVGGQVDIVFTGVATAIGHVKGGTLKVLAVLGRNRSSLMPEVPTMIESGYPDVVAGSWFGVFAPTGTSPDIVQKLATELTAVTQAPAFTQQLATLGSERVVELGPQFGQSIAADRKLWQGIAQQAGIQLVE